MARKTTEIVSLSLRIREELRKRLEREAKRAGRSMNAEIVYKLEQSFQQGDIIETIKEMTYDLRTELKDVRLASELNHALLKHALEDMS